MTGSLTPRRIGTSRVTRRSASRAVVEEAPVRSVPQGQEMEVPVAAPRISDYVPVHPRCYGWQYTEEGLQATVLREEKAANATGRVL